jgi:hypothetical protein
MAQRASISKDSPQYCFSFHTPLPPRFRCAGRCSSAGYYHVDEDAPATVGQNEPTADLASPDSFVIDRRTKFCSTRRPQLQPTAILQMNLVIA